MEDKVRRDSKKFLEREFKKRDTNGKGCISIKCIPEILDDLVPGYDREVMDKMVNELKKDSKFVELNKTTGKFEVLKEKETLDFPAAMSIAVHFLVKQEQKATRFCFAGNGLVKLDNLPSAFGRLPTGPAPAKSTTKRMY